LQNLEVLVKVIVNMLATGDEPALLDGKLGDDLGATTL
jgi:hypothetical protein